ncbi:MAG TPA: periplasmic heavy metal sensor [Burkholderiales bacterium]|nr:periplasmic heavy metal sensor [Burkholderiales bacterium]
MNRFRRMTLATLAGGAALFGTGALAHGRWGRGGGAMDPAEMDERIERFVKHLGVEVDATPEQQARLAEIAKAAAKDLAPLRGQAMETRKQALELLGSESVDRAAIERLRVEKLQHADTVSRRLADALADAAEVLTPEQRKTLAERAARHGRRRWHHG